MPMKSSPRRRGPDPGQVIEEVVVSTSEAAAAVGKEMRLKRKRKLPEESEEAVLEEVQDQVVIQSAEGRSQVVIRGTDGSMIIQDIGEEEALTTTTGAAGESQQYVIQTEEGEVISGEEVVTEYHDNIAEDEEDEEADEDGRVANHRYKIGKGEVNSEDGENNSDMVLTMVPKTVCHAYVIAKTVKEFRDLGRDMLRIHAENHGIEHASKLRMSELVREMIQHYNGVHNAGMEVSKLDQLKLNMLTLKKVKVDLREKTPPPDITKLIPKNVVPIEEQVHHVYEKRPDICTVEIIVNNLKDMLALGTSILRPEASKHRVVEELWEHYLKFHLKDTEQGGMIVSNGMVKELVGDEYVEYRYQDQEDGGQVILVSEGDLVAGEDIHTAAEEVTA